MKQSKFNPWKGLCALICLVTISAASAAPQKSSTKSKATSVKASFVNKALLPIAGTWLLRKGEKLDPTTKLVLDKNGKFIFAGSAWKSTGTYDYKEGMLILSWLTVDGSKVKPGTMRKEISLTEALDSFTIDRFTYGKKP